MAESGGLDKNDAAAAFRAHVEKAAQFFKTLPRNSPVRLISHFDADGLSACAIIIKALSRENRLHAVRVVQNLDDRVLSELAREDYAAFIFADLGSGQLGSIARLLPGRQVFILDHHSPQQHPGLPASIIQVNPHLFGIDGSQDISGSGVAWLFAQALNPANADMAHIAVIGMLGDMQGCGSGELNRSIVEASIAAGRISVRQGLRLFGMQTRPLHKVLEYSTDPLIPGVSGSESGAIQFLKQHNIPPKDNRQQWRRFIDLTEEEMRALATGIVLRRLSSSKEATQANAEDILGDVYLIEGEAEGTPLRDAKEFSTVLNACGRMDRASVGIGACLGDARLKKAALDTVAEYRREIMNALRWVERSQDSGSIHMKDGYLIINAGEEVPHAIIGTVASILSKNNQFPPGTFILSLAETRDRSIKASLRVCGDSPGFDLRQILQEMTHQISGALAGGHRAAAGALVPLDAEAELISNAHAVLGKYALEERVI